MMFFIPLHCYKEACAVLVLQNTFYSFYIKKPKFSTRTIIQISNKQKIVQCSAQHYLFVWVDCLYTIRVAYFEKTCFFFWVMAKKLSNENKVTFLFDCLTYTIIYINAFLANLKNFSVIVNFFIFIMKIS